MHDRCAELNIGQPDGWGVLDISVTVDGSWQKRGHACHNGIVAVVELLTHLVIDYVPLSNYSAACHSGPAEDDPTYRQWLEEHKPNCQKNTKCSSGAMESEGASIAFGRSVQLHNFGYMNMLGDGDARTFARLLQDAPCGADNPIEKIECVNHVTKRLETALRNLVEKKKAQKEPVGDHGKLTQLWIKKLTNYYGRAIKDHSGDLQAVERAVYGRAIKDHSGDLRAVERAVYGRAIKDHSDDLQAVERAVWASFFHSTSQEDDPHHIFSPQGQDSWCFYQRALLAGASPLLTRRPCPQ